MKIAIDIGNSGIKVGKYEDEVLVAVDIYAINEKEMCCEELKSLRDYPAIVGSTSLSEEEFIAECGLTQAMSLNKYTQYPIRLTYNQPWTLGKDRIAAAVAAYSEQVKNNVLVCDAGTCITYDVIDKSGIHLGGMISPGLEMRLKAMHEMTARLPLVIAGSEVDGLATTTEEALQAGGKYGMLLEIEGYINYLKHTYLKQDESIVVYASGGDSSELEKYLSEDIKVDENLVLKGLIKILEWNEKKI